MNALNGDVDQNNNNNSTNNNNNGSNNNNNSSSDNKNISTDDNQHKLKYELPSDYKHRVHKCICFRTQQTFECERCHHYFHGRISAHCEVHPRDIFLMDFYQCPYCLGSTEEVKVSNLSWAQIRKMEDADLPNDGDEL